MASCSEGKLSPLAKQVANKDRGCESRVAHCRCTKSPTADRQAHGQREGRSCFVWKPSCLTPLVILMECPAFPFILNTAAVNLSSQQLWPQQARHRRPREPCPHSSAAVSSSLSSPQSWTRTVPAGVACRLLRVRTEPRARPSQLLLGLRAVQQNAGRAQTPLGPSEDGNC